MKLPSWLTGVRGPITLPDPPDFDHYHHLQNLVETALYDAQSAAAHDPDNEALTHARNALSDAYRYLGEASTNHYLRQHPLITRPNAREELDQWRNPMR